MPGGNTAIVLQPSATVYVFLYTVHLHQYHVMYLSHMQKKRIASNLQTAGVSSGGASVHVQATCIMDTVMRN